MSDTIMMAIISLVGIIVSGIVSIVVAQLTNSKTVALVDLRLQQLEEKQDKHNSVIERMFKLEQKVDDLVKFKSSK